MIEKGRLGGWIEAIGLVAVFVATALQITVSDSFEDSMREMQSDVQRSIGYAQLLALQELARQAAEPDPLARRRMAHEISDDLMKAQIGALGTSLAGKRMSGHSLRADLVRLKSFLLLIGALMAAGGKLLTHWKKPIAASKDLL
jgi:hypothetical protein